MNIGLHLSLNQLTKFKLERYIMKNKRIENKINRYYSSTIAVREWYAKHYHKFITDPKSLRFELDDPKGFAEISKYCYDQNYGEYKQNNEG